MDNQAEIKRNLKKIRLEFFGYIVGIFLTFSAYVSMLNLQSSINIEDGLGTITVAVSYVVSNIFLIFFTPMLLRTFGAKKCLIASELTYMIYVLANLYPEFYTLMPAAVIVGSGEALFWPCVTILNVHYSLKIANARKHPTKEDDFYVNLYSGYFFTAFQCTQIFGNLITYAVLFGFGEKIDENQKGGGNTTNIPSASTSSALVDPYEYCGAQDCQDVEVVGDSIDHYVPADRITIVILITIFAIMCVVAQITHWYVLPTELLKSGQSNNENKTGCDNSTFEDDFKKSEGELSTDTTDSLQKKGRDFWKSYVKSLKDLLQQMKETRQLLLIPLCLYIGFTQAFIFSELTRAFSSCVLGVAMIGIHMAIFGFADAVLSYVVAKLGYKLGRVPFFLISMVIDASCYTYCLLWNPDPDESWSIYLVFTAFGISDGIWQTLLNVMFLEYFPSTHDVAMTMWSLWITLGFSIQFAWSKALCVYIKIYIQLCLLASGMICYGVAERINNKLKREKKMISETRL